MTRRKSDERRGDRDLQRIERPAPYTPRSTFRVAAARRVLAETLPDVVFRKEAPRPSVMREEPCVGCLGEAAKASVSSPRKLARRDDVVPDRQPLDMRKSVDTCKGKPSGKPKAGGGSGRPFVPWCGGGKK